METASTFTVTEQTPLGGGEAVEDAVVLPLLATQRIRITRAAWPLVAVSGVVSVLALCAFFFVANYTLSFLSVFALRRKEPETPRPSGRRASALGCCQDRTSEISGSFSDFQRGCDDPGFRAQGNGRGRCAVR